jgi:glutaredoxin-like protein
MRSWRYAMIVRDGLIEKMFVEPEVEGDPYEVSDADTVLKWLDPDARTPASVAVFTRIGCPHCARAKRLLEEHGVDYEELVLDRRVTAKSLRAVAGVDTDTVPQVYIDGRRIGGADDLERYLREHEALAA